MHGDIKTGLTKIDFKFFSAENVPHHCRYPGQAGEEGGTWPLPIPGMPLEIEKAQGDRIKVSKTQVQSGREQNKSKQINPWE